MEEAKKEGIAGSRFKKCSGEDELDSFYAEQLQGNGHSTDASTSAHEPTSPFASLPIARFTELRRAIEKGDNKRFDELLQENPRFVINTNLDTPTIIQEGFRFNTLHVACRSSNVYVVRRVLEQICDLEWLDHCYGTRVCVEGRSCYLLNAFLNTPDTGENNVPLHYACKFGNAKIVDLLLNHRVCKKHPQNKYKERPIDMLCRSFKGSADEKSEASWEITARIQGRQTPSPHRKSLTCTPSSSPRYQPDRGSPSTPVSSLAHQLRTKLMVSDASKKKKNEVEDEEVYESAESDSEEYEDVATESDDEAPTAPGRRYCSIG